MMSLAHYVPPAPELVKALVLTTLNAVIWVVVTWGLERLRSILKARQKAPVQVASVGASAVSTATAGALPQLPTTHTPTLPAIKSPTTAYHRSGSQHSPARIATSQTDNALTSCLSERNPAVAASRHSAKPAAVQLSGVALTKPSQPSAAAPSTGTGTGTGSSSQRSAQPTTGSDPACPTAKLQPARPAGALAAASSSPSTTTCGDTVCWTATGAAAVSGPGSSVHGCGAEYCRALSNSSVCCVLEASACGLADASRASSMCDDYNDPIPPTASAPTTAERGSTGGIVAPHLLSSLAPAAAPMSATPKTKSSNVAAASPAKRSAGVTTPPSSSQLTKRTSAPAAVPAGASRSASSASRTTAKAAVCSRDSRVLPNVPCAASMAGLLAIDYRRGSPASGASPPAQQQCRRQEQGDGAWPLHKPAGEAEAAFASAASAGKDRRALLVKQWLHEQLTSPCDPSVILLLPRP